MKGEVYRHPLYYDIAFSFRDIAHEVDTMERCIDRFSRIPIHTVLELGCGPAPHMAELMRRGYEYIGLDLSQEMLDFAGSRALQSGLSPTLLKKNMVQFRLDTQVDFAFVLLGSLFVSTSADLVSHFESVAEALRPGGLYLLDWCVQFEKAVDGFDSWEMERDAVRTKVSSSTRGVDPSGQTFEEIIRITVEDGKKTLELEDMNTRRAIYPQEFLLFTEKTGCFEFVGWWNNWNLDEPLGESEPYLSERKIERPIAVIRRI